ncbi:putative uncharacterized protein [Vibrio anguillarum]|nr:hypothetical protein VAA_02223 [Vibrio anguillarum 775]ARV28020.1 hypothetical protein A6A12_0913 [Vibrio anguillarum]CDQ49959.1 putative uncharacterized protein [Vibrio anguillarum]
MAFGEPSPLYLLRFYLNVCRFIGSEQHLSPEFNLPLLNFPNERQSFAFYLAAENSSGMMRTVYRYPY